MRGNPWFAAAARLAAGGPIETEGQLRAVARALVLLALEPGPRRPADVTRAWPVTRIMIRRAVADAIAAGLCDSDETAGGVLRLAARGRARLEGMRARRTAAQLRAAEVPPNRSA